MKFSCLQENLLKGIQLVLSASSKESSLPILSTLLLKTDQGSLVVSATNLELGVRCTIRGKVEEEGCIALDARLFSDTISLLPKEKIELEIKDSTILIIRCENYSTKIRGVNPDDFPLIPTCERKKSLIFSCQELKKALQSTLFVVSTQERIQPELRGLFLHFLPQQKKVLCVSTDGFRLAERSVQVTSTCTEEIKIILPFKTSVELLRGISLFEQEECEMWCTENQVLFLYGTSELTSKLINGAYPDYTHIIPKTSITKAVVEAKECLKAFKTVGLFSKIDVYDIQMEFTILQEGRGELRCFSSNATTGEGEVKIPIEIKGIDQKITLNYRYLVDGFQTSDEEKITLELIDSYSPCVIKPLKQQEKLYLIMPIRE